MKRLNCTKHEKQFFHQKLHQPMSRIILKPSIGKNRGEDQLQDPATLISASNFATYVIQYIYFLNQKLQACGYRFVSDQVGNHQDRFSHDAPHMILSTIQRLTFSCKYFCFNSQESPWTLTNKKFRKHRMILAFVILVGGGNQMSLIVSKLVFGVSDQVQH